MKMFVVRLNPDTRDCLSYSKYPTVAEYRRIREKSPMDGFHEAVNFLPENGIVRGYLPPRHLAGMRTGKPFVLITITAKTATVGGDQIVGIQAGCRYKGETPRPGRTRADQSLRLTWHYSCPHSLSMLLEQPIPGARSLILGRNGTWVRGPTLQIKRSAQNRIIESIANEIQAPKSRKRFQLLMNRADQTPHPFAEELFDADVAEALRSPLESVLGNKYPSQKEVRTFQYERDPYVVAYALRKANGICQDCRKEGPFISKTTGLPYLEAHHITMLRDGGSDTSGNVVALCPNCHRARHYG